MSQKLFEQDIESLRVLAVDDEALMLKMIDFSLKAIGIQHTITAPNGLAALGLFESAPKKFDLIICDWEMPKMNGLDFLKKIRADKHETKFLMLTGNVTKESVTAAIEAGANAYIGKPFTVDQLKTKVLSLVKK